MQTISEVLFWVAMVSVILLGAVLVSDLVSHGATIGACTWGGF